MLWTLERFGFCPVGEAAAWVQDGRIALGGELPVLDLPADAPRPSRQSFAGAMRGYALPFDIGSQLASLAQEHGASLFMALVAAVKTLLHRYTGSEDLIVGSPLAGREPHAVLPDDHRRDALAHRDAAAGTFRTRPETPRFR